MSMYTIPVIVTSIRDVTPIIKEFTLTRKGGEELLGFSGGSHIVVVMPSSPRVFKNPYSLVGHSQDRRSYTIAVRLEEEGRGGSLFMHRQVMVGSELAISQPCNLFPLNATARKHILIAGGVGITPMMAYLKDLPFLMGEYELHYAMRNRAFGAYVDDLTRMLGDRLHTYNDEKNTFIDIDDLLMRQPLGTHVYVCGPAGMVNAVMQTGKDLGWPEASLHYEIFAAPEPGKAFTALLNRSGQEITVDENETLLDALESHAVDVDSLCRGGACGFCKTRVIEGFPDHRDFYLSSEEKDSNQYIMPCVSRCRSESITLDL